MQSNGDQERIVQALRAGGHAREVAVAQLYTQLYPKLVTHLMMQGCARHDAEDCVQEAFIKMLRNFHQFRGDSSLTTWIYTILQNTWIDRKRSAYETRRADVESNSIEPINEAQYDLNDTNSPDLIDCVRSGYEQYRRKYQECAAWLYRLVEGASVSELAEEAGRTPGAMREHLSQCRKKLAPYIEHCRSLLQT